MRSAHHAGNVMPGECEPHRQMAADRARAEDAYPHEVDVLFERPLAEGLVSTKRAGDATGHEICV
jgi:hypothetical protein